MRGRKLLAVVAVLLVVLGSGCGRLKRFGYEGIGRDRWQKPDQVISSLGIESGQHVADLGAGGGYFTFRLAGAVGPEGKVYAVDVDPDMTGLLEGRVSDEGADNVEVVLAEYHDPLLPPTGVDLIFTCNTYHHFEDRVAYFQGASRYLRPGGRVAIVEGAGKSWFSKIFSHATPADVIRTEMETAGYRLLEAHDFLPRQHFLVFERGG
jgi:ubiquinone/menaquinone biosynthesis C-methylase UbiE